MFVDEETGSAMEEMSLVELIQQPGFKLDKPRLTMDFSKPAVKDRLKSSFSGGNPSAQIVVYRLMDLSRSDTDVDLEFYLKHWLDATYKSTQRIGG